MHWTHKMAVNFNKVNKTNPVPEDYLANVSLVEHSVVLCSISIMLRQSSGKMVIARSICFSTEKHVLMFFTIQYSINGWNRWRTNRPRRNSSI